MASAMSDLFTVSFVAASLVLRISVRGRARAIAARGPLGSLTKVFRPFVCQGARSFAVALASQFADQWSAMHRCS